MEHSCYKGELSCHEDEDGHFILDCVEYEWEVNYCPICGEEAPMNAD